MPDSTPLTWTLIGELQPGANWLSTSPTTANAFRFDHHNPPKRVILHIAQTDGMNWLFEPRLLSSDRESQVLILDNSPVFAGERRISLRYGDPNADIKNWTVSVFAATVPGSADLASLQVSIAGLATQQTILVNSLTALQSGITSLEAGQTALHSQLTDLIASNAQIRAVLSLPTPTPTPTPSPTVPSAAGIPYTFSQSSVYNGTAGSYANLNDHDGSTGCLTNGGQSSLQASFPYPVLVTAVTLGGGTVSTAGLIAAAGLNGSKLQFSTDQTTWIDVLTVAGVQDSGGNQFVTFPLSSPITAQYGRLFGNGYLGTTEFRFT